MHHHPSLIYPALAAFIAVFGAWTALDLFGRARRYGGRVRRRWVALSAVALGTSIWSMDFIAMLGFDPGGPVAYDLARTVGSLLLAIGGTAAAFAIVAGPGRHRGRIAIGGLIMGLSIGAMHYLGMAALRTAAVVGYRPGWVIVSFIVAFLASVAALAATRRDGQRIWRIWAALWLGGGIVAMHYSAMAAVTLMPGAGVPSPEAVPPLWLALGVANLTLLLLFLALGTSLVDQKQVLMQALQAGRLGYWDMDLARNRLLLSAEGRALLGLADDQTFDQGLVPDLLTPDSAARRAASLRHSVETGDDYETDYEMRDGRWLEVRGRVLRDGSGRPARLVGTMQDVTRHRVAYQQLQQSEARQRVLINELNHRVKNTLAKVLSIATLSARKARALDVFVPAFRARLLAMSATQDLLTADHWEGTSIRRVFEAEFAHLDPEQTVLEGPDLWLQPETVLNLGLIIHELATNAAKYGALVQAGGCVHVDWTSSDAGLVVHWRETGGPPASPPTAPGFGTRLIERSAKSVQMTYAPTGFSTDFVLERREGPRGILEL